MPIIAAGLGILGVWLVGLWVTGHRGWAWLPVATTAAALPLMQPLGPQFDRLLSSLWTLLAFVVIGVCALALAARARALAMRTVAGAVLIPVLVVTTLYACITFYVASIG